MAIPILAELSQEMTRLYVAGSALAKDDPRLKKYIPALSKLGEKAPVFNALAERITTLTECEEKQSAAALMDAGSLLFSIMYTQGDTDTGAEIADLPYMPRPLKVEQTPYSDLSEIVRLLESGSEKHSTLVEELFAANKHKDPRLFPYYVKSIGVKQTYVSKFIAATVLPDIGADILPYLFAVYDPEEPKRGAHVFAALANIMGDDIFPYAEDALQKGDALLIAQALRALGRSQKYEETIIAYSKDRKKEIRFAALEALAIMGSQAAEDMLIEHLQPEKFTIHTFDNVKDAMLLTKSPKVVACLLERAQSLMKPKYETGEWLKLHHILNVLALRSEPECLGFIEKLLSDPKIIKQYSLDSVAANLTQTLYMRNEPVADAIVLRLPAEEYSLVYQVATSHRSGVSPEELYEKYRRKITDDNVCRILQWIFGYSVKSEHKAQRAWDKRWARHMINSKNLYYFPEYAYDDDLDAWGEYMDFLVKHTKTVKNNRLYMIVARPFAIKHPKAQKNYESLQKSGMQKALLLDAIMKVAPEAAADLK